MFNKLKLILGIILFLSFCNLTIAKENFFNDAKNKFDAKKLEETLFLIQRMQNHIYIWQKFIILKKMKKKKKKI